MGIDINIRINFNILIIPFFSKTVNYLFLLAIFNTEKNKHLLIYVKKAEVYSILI